MSNWREREKRDIAKLKDYADALERREKFLIDALSELAQGYGQKDPKEPHERWESAMRRLAVSRLNEVARIRVPPRPYL